MAVVCRFQHRSTVACEFPGATDRKRCCTSGGTACSRLHVQSCILAALVSRRPTYRLERRHYQSRTRVRAGRRICRIVASRGSEVARKQWRRASDAGLPQHGRPRCTRLFACEGARRSRARHHDRHSASRHGLRALCARKKYAPDAAGMRLRAPARRECGTVEFICFASQHDNLVVPRDSQVLACAEAVWFEKIGHLAMTASDEVLTKLWR